MGATGTLERWIYYKPRNKNGELLENQCYSLGTSTYEDIFTMGGIVAAACHGTGRNYPSVSDWLVAVEFVDADAFICRVEINGNLFRKEKEEDEWQEWKPNFPEGLDEQDLFRVVICNYGLIGVMWSLTIRIIPGFDTLFIAQNLPWKEYLDDTEECRKNLNELQNNSHSLEFFYYPFVQGSTPVSWGPNPNVYLLRNIKDTPENRAKLEAQGFSIVNKDEEYFLHRDGRTRFFTNFYSQLITFLLNKKRHMVWRKTILPCVLGRIPAHLEYTVDGHKKEAIPIPHWRANHSVNAVGAVEKIHVLNIEWTMPMQFNDPTGNGLTHALRAYSHLIKEIHLAAERGHFPVTVVAEIRFFRGSQAYMAPTYDPHFHSPDDPFENPEGPYGGWAAPEIVTGVHNPWWIDFMTRMNKEIYKNAEPGIPIRNHLAKQYGSIPKQFRRLREQFDDCDEDCRKIKPLKRFGDIRRMLDPEGVFLAPFLDQLIHKNSPHYLPPPSYKIMEDGTFSPLRLSQGASKHP